MTMTEEHKRKISEALKISMNQPLVKEKIRKWATGRKFSVEVRRKISEALTKNNPMKKEEARKKLSKKTTLWMKNPENRKRISKGVLKAINDGRLKVPVQDTIPELITEKWLLDNKYLMCKQYSIFGVGLVDFYLPEKNVVLECDGDFWHAHPDKYDSEEVVYNGLTAKQIWDKDRRKTENLQKLGYTVYRFWERDLKKDVSCLKVISN